MPDSARFKIRFRERRGHSREAGGYAAWTEVQVVEGRRVVGRFDLEHQAQAWIARQDAAS
jgi:hypothetical protein